MEAAQGRVAAWTAAGERVVLADGVFELLHVGHTRALAAARAAGTRLVVAVHEDPVAPGPGRRPPVVEARDRARVVAALRAVDLVVILDAAGLERAAAAWRPVARVPIRDGEPGTGDASSASTASRTSADLVRRVRERHAGA
jgi:cytidyltransferase-like protein